MCARLYMRMFVYMSVRKYFYVSVDVTIYMYVFVCVRAYMCVRVRACARANAYDYTLYKVLTYDGTITKALFLFSVNPKIIPFFPLIYS